MKLYLHEGRVERDVTLFGVQFVNGEAEVSDREFTLIETLEKYNSVQRTPPPAKAAPKAPKAEKVEKE